MPTKRQRKTHNLVHIDPDVWRLLMDEAPAARFAQFHEITAGEWQAYRDDVLKEWVRRSPGTRPSHWWTYDAPELRQRLGGTGEPFWTWAKAIKPVYQLGVPAMWIERQYAFECGDRGMVKHSIEPADPPRFESQPAYLARLSLFFEGERARVPKSDFEPELVA